MLILILSLLLNVTDIVSFNKTVHDFGEIERDATLKTCVFRMFNNSDEAVEIVAAGTSCSCTKVTGWTKGAIPPGKMAVIYVEYHTELFSQQIVERDILIYLKNIDKPIKLQIIGHYRE